MEEYTKFKRDGKGALLIQKYMNIKEYETIEPFIEELLAKLFTIKVDIRPVKYLVNSQTRGDGVSFEARISFPAMDEFLIKRVDEVITNLVDEKMKHYTITITPTLKPEYE